MNTPFRIAVIATEYRDKSHADVIVSRWLEPRPTDSLYDWAPRTQIASFYLDQIPGNDLSAEMGRKHGIPRFDTVEGALTLGGDSLAVDAVLLIGEHGNYPINELQQKLYPRKELFDRVTAVFRKSGRVVPVFFDKHFSWNIPWIHEMYWTVREMGIPFFGGSSIPHCELVPPVNLAGPSPLKELVFFYWDALEAYLFHSLELSQSLIENRPGAKGPVDVVAWRDAGVWEALERGEFSSALLDSALAAISGETLEAMHALRRGKEGPLYAFQIRYGDGLKTTHVMQPTLGRKWALAAQTADGNVSNARVETGGAEHFFPHFAVLSRKAQEFFLSGVSPVAPERLYLTSMETAASMHALATPGVRRKLDWLVFPPARELPAAAPRGKAGEP